MDVWYNLKQAPGSEEKASASLPVRRAAHDQASGVKPFAECCQTDSEIQVCHTGH